MKRNILTYAVIFSLLVRILCIFLFANVAHPEMWEFGTIARNLLNGEGFTYIANTVNVPSAYMPPGLPVLYYIFFKLFGDAERTYVIILLFNSILASVNVIIIYKIAKIIYDQKIAALSAVYAALSPVFIYSSINFNSVIIYQLLIGLLFLLFLKLQWPAPAASNSVRIRISLLLSLTLGIFIYFRSEVFGLAAILCLYLFIKQRKSEALLILAAVIVIVSPWTVRNYFTFGKLTPVSTSVGYNFYTGHGDEYSTIEFNRRISLLKEDSTFEIEKSNVGFEEAFKYISGHPSEEIKDSFIKIFSLWFIDQYRDNARNPVYLLTWLPTIILFFTGLLMSLKNRSLRHKLFFMNLYLLFSTLLVVVFFNIPRYQIQMSIIMIPTAMFGLFGMYTHFFSKAPVEFKTDK